MALTGHKQMKLNKCTRASSLIKVEVQWQPVSVLIIPLPICGEMREDNPLSDILKQSEPE